MTLKSILDEFVRRTLSECHECDKDEEDNCSCDKKKDEPDRLDEDDLDEFSAVGGGAIQGFTAPLGSSRKTHKTKKKKR